MSWDYRIIIVVPVALSATAEAIAKQIDRDRAEESAAMFGMRLSQSGEEPATHLALYTSATPAMVEAMVEAMPGLPGVMFWRHGVGDDLQASNVTPASGQPWGWLESMEAAGLTRILPPLA